MYLFEMLMLASIASAAPYKRQSKLIPVVVGGTQNLFIPNRVTAAPGDVIQFQFNAGNHTVTQSAEDQACVPLQQTQPGAIHSGYIPLEDGQMTVGTFNMPVNTTDTIFLYCATGPHCQDGQVMVINPDQQIIDYAKRATAVAESVDGTDVSSGVVGAFL